MPRVSHILGKHLQLLLKIPSARIFKSVMRVANLSCFLLAFFPKVSFEANGWLNDAKDTIFCDLKFMRSKFISIDDSW